MVEVIRTESEDVKIGEHYTGFLRECISPNARRLILS